MNFLNNTKIIIFSIFSVIIIDLFFKYIAKIYLIGEKINIIGDIFYIKYVENIGVAFGFAITGIILKIITIVLIVAIICYYFKEEYNKKNKYIDLSFGLILGGGISNGIERIFNGYVIDFIGVKYFSVFNIADVAISLGAIIYIIILLIENKKGLHNSDQKK